MPLIPYQCEKCDHYFEITQGYHDERLTKCPECKKSALKQVFCSPYIAQPIQSVGSLAEKNTREMGIYGREAKWKADTENRDAVKLKSLKELGVVSESATEIPKEQKHLEKLRHIISDPKKTKDYIEKGIK
jgi:putative FmdB family regulatory protein